MNNPELDEYIKTFVAIPTDKKPQEIINTLKEDLAKTADLCHKFGVDVPVLLNREMIDVNKEDTTIDDYYEAIFAYIKSLEDAYGKLLLILSELIEQNN